MKCIDVIVHLQGDMQKTLYVTIHGEKSVYVLFKNTMILKKIKLKMSIDLHYSIFSINWEVHIT